jgi:hypothetical protein
MKSVLTINLMGLISLLVAVHSHLALRISISGKSAVTVSNYLIISMQFQVLLALHAVLVLPMTIPKVKVPSWFLLQQMLSVQ